MSGSPAISPRRLALAAAALLLASVLLTGASAPALQALAYLLPALLLLSALWARRYPGERALLAAIVAPGPGSGSGADAARQTAPALRALLPRGGRLIACSLAVRPPPGAPRISL
jgi:hypothetical protein